MQKFEKLEYDKFYHIYNCGNNGENLFLKNEDYERFLRLYDKYVDPIADTFAWVLMKNHFHFLVRVKEENEIGFYKPFSTERSIDTLRFQVTTDPSAFKEPDRMKIKPDPTKHFSHLFNAYTKYFNPKHNRRGSLFSRPFKRKHISSDKYFRQLVIYINNNPVHHGFVEHPIEYPWSSYQTCISLKPTKLKRESVMGWFDDVANFKTMHKGKIEHLKIEEELGI